MSYKVEQVEEIARRNNASLQWLEGEVARIECTDVPTEQYSEVTNKTQAVESKNAVFYLIPAYGGVNKLCTDIKDSVQKRMMEDKKKSESCISYLSNEKVVSRDSWLDRGHHKMSWRSTGQSRST
ncbi:uncharacterized protein TNCT_215381 [Trichonephila clavata]|uniref:Uncharacterized protein n=1 Tax=Trichonephila clavata TaxID=2740835 RepID=A0A8X6KFB3_TRICU|nr:uncharacterized protein TNCT_215381 [Trichonephila clavata]